MREQKIYSITLLSKKIHIYFLVNNASLYGNKLFDDNYNCSYKSSVKSLVQFKRIITNISTNPFIRGKLLKTTPFMVMSKMAINAHTFCCYTSLVIIFFITIYDAHLLNCTYKIVVCSVFNIMLRIFLFSQKQNV